MMKRLFFAMLVLLALAACGADGAAVDTVPAAAPVLAETVVDETAAAAAQPAPAVVVVPGDGVVAGGADAVAVGAETAVIPLTTDYPDALSLQAQLALGAIQLDETDLAVDETQAAALLPLWQALSALSRSDTTAVAELNAVINQIQESMTPAQISAIAAMRLTGATVTELQESGVLVAGRQGGGSAGLGVPGGGRGQGGGMGGGIPGAGADPNAQATRQAESAASGANPSEQMLTNAVLRLLQTKTGVVAENRSGAFEEMWQILGEATGLEVTALRERMAAGETPAALIEANGGEVTAVVAQLRLALETTELAETQDLDTFINDLLYGQNQ
jgi:hypothetical protein